MRSTGVLMAGCMAVALTAACESHLPPLETGPFDSAPRVTDVIGHIQCELASIVNNDGGNIRLKKILDSREGGKSLDNLLEYLAKYHVVATTQLSLEVTDNEGLDPTLSFIRADTLRTIGIGGQLTSTQDRNLTLSFAIDLASMKDGSGRGGKKEYRRTYCGESPPKTGEIDSISNGFSIGGDLGFAEIIAEGLTSLEKTSANNIYSAAPAPISVGRLIEIDGNAKINETLAGDPNHYNKVTGSLELAIKNGALLFSPQAPGSSNLGSVSLNGTVNSSASLTPDDSNHDAIRTVTAAASYVASLTGSIFPATTEADLISHVRFTLSGNLTQVAPGMAPAKGDQIYNELMGTNPAISLVGDVEIGLTNTQNPEPCYSFRTMKLSGYLTPQAQAGGMPPPVSPIMWTSNKYTDPSEKEDSSEFCRPPTAPNGDNERRQSELLAEIVTKPSKTPGNSGSGTTTSAGSSAGGKPGGGSAGSAGGTSFGSLITFTLVEGVSGGPTWTLKTFTGPGSTPISLTRTLTDSVTISFVPACQDFENVPPLVTPTSYWETLPSCNEVGTQVAQGVGQANITNMLLYKFGVGGGKAP